MIDEDAVAALGDERIDWRHKGLPPRWSGRTLADIRAERPRLRDEALLSPLCVLDADSLRQNIATMSDWCRAAGVELAPHGKTHMAPQLLAMQLDAGACGVTAATIAQVRAYRAFGVRNVILANELVDAGGLQWLAREFETDPEFGFLCWVDSVAGVEIMAAELGASACRPVDVCVEVGIAGGRTGCRTRAAIDEVATAIARCPQLRLVGVAGYEAARGHQVTTAAQEEVGRFLAEMRRAVARLAHLFESDDVVVTAGGSTYFDIVSDALTGDWPAGLRVRTVLRSGAYVAHDHGLYQRTSPLTREGRSGFRPALSVWAQVVSMPEPGLAVVTMGRRDVSFDQDLPVPLGLGSDSQVTKLNDQHAYLTLGSGRDEVGVGSWVRFGISHPCTVMDKWQVIPMVDARGCVVDLIRTFF